MHLLITWQQSYVGLHAIRWRGKELANIKGQPIATVAFYLYWKRRIRKADSVFYNKHVTEQEEEEEEEEE